MKRVDLMRDLSDTPIPEDLTPYQVQIAHVREYFGLRFFELLDQAGIGEDVELSPDVAFTLREKADQVFLRIGELIDYKSDDPIEKYKLFGAVHTQVRDDVANVLRAIDSNDLPIMTINQFITALAEFIQIDHEVFSQRPQGDVASMRQRTQKMQKNVDIEESFYNDDRHGGVVADVLRIVGFGEKNLTPTEIQSAVEVALRDRAMRLKEVTGSTINPQNIDTFAEEMIERCLIALFPAQAQA